MRGIQKNWFVGAGSQDAAPLPLSRLVVPILLAVGWIVGCALMVYIVFS
ncbi:sarcoplasmic/endoplasmic reticulum calcium ATPase regulator DWORF [Lagopus muta]|nr:sarcoplasmic/endoplasmic reticulum calcium ATPase regulator DWORF [Lagopus muta]